MTDSQTMSVERRTSGLRSDSSLLRDVMDPLSMVRGLVKEGCAVHDAQKLILAYYGQVYTDPGGGCPGVDSEVTSSTRSNRSLRSERFFSQSDEWLVKTGYCYTTLLRPSRRQEIATRLGPDIRLDQVFKLPFGAVAWHRMSQLRVVKIDNWHVHLTYDDVPDAASAVGHFAAFAADFPTLVPQHWLEALAHVRPVEDGWFGMTTVFGADVVGHGFGSLVPQRAARDVGKLCADVGIEAGFEQESLRRLSHSSNFLDTSIIHRYENEDAALSGAGFVEVRDYGYTLPDVVFSVSVVDSFSAEFVPERWYKFEGFQPVVLHVSESSVKLADGTVHDFFGREGFVLFPQGVKQPFGIRQVNKSSVLSLHVPDFPCTDYQVAVKLDIGRICHKLFRDKGSTQLYLPRDVARLLGSVSLSDVDRTIHDGEVDSTYDGIVLVRHRHHCLRAAQQYPKASVRHMQSIVGVRVEEIVLLLYEDEHNYTHWDHRELAVGFSRHTRKLTVVGLQYDRNLLRLFRYLNIT